MFQNITVMTIIRKIWKFYKFVKVYFRLDKKFNNFMLIGFIKTDMINKYHTYYFLDDIFNKNDINKTISEIAGIIEYNLLMEKETKDIIKDAIINN